MKFTAKLLCSSWGATARRGGKGTRVVSFDGGTAANEANHLRRSPKSRRTFFASLPVAKLITFSDVRWATISYRRGIATYRPLSLARTSRILFLGCGFARYTLLGNWTWSGHAGSALAAHLLPLLYLWVAKFTKRCGSELRMPAGATTRPRSTTSFDVTRFKTERRIGTSPAHPLLPISQKTLQKFACSHSKPTPLLDPFVPDPYVFFVSSIPSKLDRVS